MVHSSGKRLREARLAAGFASMVSAADRFNWNASTYRSHENGQTPVPREAAEEYAKAFKTSAAWILLGVNAGGGGRPASGLIAAETSQAKPLPSKTPVSRWLPLYGPARGGSEETLAFSEIVEHIPAPPVLESVRDGYAVYVTGESMEPRYYAGEALYIDPRRPVRRHDFVVVQFYPNEAGENPQGIVKQFINWTANKLVLQQFNPAKRLELDKKRVKSVHRVVLAGEI